MAAAAFAAADFAAAASAALQLVESLSQVLAFAGGGFGADVARAFAFAISRKIAFGTAVNAGGSLLLLMIPADFGHGP